ncbi:hypothetical protein CVT26_008879 [Gymnopilus dilepis]|uniref:Uncharacterized protein n=1 Tax=Gymnopilus dilepis TaxID=231916 RepID=A0A409YAY5_9AGAR|nr:hypothetical protein CVT26_008879 [Gymnopilus dilepis]
MSVSDRTTTSPTSAPSNSNHATVLEPCGTLPVSVPPEAPTNDPEVSSSSASNDPKTLWLSGALRVRMEPLRHSPYSTQIVFPSDAFQMSAFPELALHCDQIELVKLKRDYLAANEYRATRTISVVRRRQQREQAEESKALALLEEAQLKRDASLGPRFAAYDPDTALKLAEAVLRVLQADETLTSSKILELREELSALEDELDEVKRRVEEATRQYGRVLLSLQA